MQRPPRARSGRGLRTVTVVTICVMLGGATATAAAAHPMIAPVGTGPAPGASEATPVRWLWPLEAFRLARAFVAPPHAYGPGHRGIDVRAIGSTDIRAPAAGVVAFSGQVAGRGILTIDHGGGLVTTLEPVSPIAVAGAVVERGEIVGVLGAGGHAEPGTLHFGVRLNGDYINPLLLLGDLPRAVLLPCC